LLIIREGKGGEFVLLWLFEKLVFNRQTQSRNQRFNVLEWMGGSSGIRRLIDEWSQVVFGRGKVRKGIVSFLVWWSFSKAALVDQRWTVVEREQVSEQIFVGSFHEMTLAK
jgi:hypothetical protein